MDYSDYWNQLLSRNNDIQGGALIKVDGVLISGSKFGTAENQKTVVAYCAAIMTIGHELNQGVGQGEFEEYILEGKQGYVVLMPVLDKAIFAVLARKQAKLGLVILDMKSAIDGSFGPGLAGEPIFPSQPPKWDSAYAQPEWD